jgi:hypothetical protein
MTAIRNPIGQEKSAVDGAISMLEIYGLLAGHIKNYPSALNLSRATAYGVGWANNGGEANAVSPENSMAVDGIENGSAFWRRSRTTSCTTWSFSRARRAPAAAWAAR